MISPLKFGEWCIVMFPVASGFRSHAEYYVEDFDTAFSKEDLELLSSVNA